MNSAVMPETVAGLKFESDSSVSYGIDVRYHIAFQDEENWDMIGVFGKLFF